MAWHAGVVWAVTDDNVFFRLSSSGTGIVSTAHLDWHPQVADLIIYVDTGTGSIVQCPAECIEEAVARIDIIEDDKIMASTGFNRHSVLNPDEIELEVGDSVFLQNGYRIGRKAPLGSARSPLEPPGPEERLVTIKKKADEIPESARRFAGYKNELFNATRILKQAFSEHDVLDNYGFPRPRGLLLSGPPGTGKTTLARKLAHEENAILYVIRGPEVLSPRAGDAESLLRLVFADAERQDKSIIFIDEIDSIAMSRRRSRQDYNQQIVAQLLTLIDGFESRGRRMIIGTTNRVDDIDEAFRRPGRFDVEIELNLTTIDDRCDIILELLGGHPPNDLDVFSLASRMDGWTGADILAALREGASLARDDGRATLWQSDLEAGLHIYREKRRNPTTKGDDAQ